MKRIEAFVEKVFEGIQLDEQLIAQKEELIFNMFDSFNDKIAIGLDEEDAFAAVVSNFGSVKELREAFELEEDKANGVSAKKIVGKIGIALLILVIILSLKYVNNRKNYLVSDLQDLAYTVSRIVFDASDSNRVQQESDIEEANVYKMLEVNISNLQRDMNALEKKRLSDTDNGLYLSYNVVEMYWKLVERKRTGYWNDLDEEVHERFVNYSKDLLRMVEEEGQLVKGERNNTDANVFRAFFYIVDIERISNHFQQLNELASAYGTYSSLPEDMTLMTIEEVEDDIRERFGDGVLEVEISERTARNILAWDCLYNDVKVTTSTGRGRVNYNACYGTIEGIDAVNFYDEQRIDDGVFLDAAWAERTLQHYLALNAHYEIIDKGLNYKIHSSLSDYKVYEFIPYYYGYPVYFGGMSSLLQVEVGNEKNINIVSDEFIKSDEQIGSVEENYSYVEALAYAFENEQEIIERRNGLGVTNEDFKYIETALDLSFLSGKYDLMHIYKLKENGRVLRIHASNGIIDSNH